MRRTILLVLAIGIFLWQPQAVYADDMPKEFLLLEELEHLLKSGQVEAYFKSVPEGTTIKEYDILIRGIYKEPGIKIIIFSTKSQIAAGMSGSPVYLKKGKLKGKLVGAVAYRVNSFAKVSWGGISPIVLMHKDQSLGDDANAKQNLTARLPESFFYENKLFEPIALGNKLLPSYLLKNYDTNAATASFLEKNKFIFSVRQTKPTQSAQIIPPKAKDMSDLLKPGMPIVVDLASWLDQSGEESSISAVGTITYVDKSSGRIYAFGHPFLGAKRVRYAFRSCKIIGVVPSDEDSFKLSGENSEVIGLIDFDSDYGIYGRAFFKNPDKLHAFNLELRKDGRTYNKFEITLADHYAFTPLIASIVLPLIGEVSNAPLPQEISTTELFSRLDIQNFAPIIFNQVFSSSSTVFGGRKLYSSSYEVAIGGYITNIYAPVFFSRYGFKIENIWLVANFSSGKPQELKVVDYRFPNKIVWGEDPILEILLVSEDNAIALEKSLKIKIDWEKVEKPIYTKETKTPEKEEEKIINGQLQIFSRASLRTFLTENEKRAFLPNYFLSPEDFLQFFAKQLTLFNQGLFGRVLMQARSGLAEDDVAFSENVINNQEQENGNGGWRIIKGGLTSRKTNKKKEDFITSLIEFPPVPSSYVIDPQLREELIFEIVKN